jgi:hypothetical protein
MSSDIGKSAPHEDGADFLLGLDAVSSSAVEVGQNVVFISQRYRGFSRLSVEQQHFINTTTS